MGEARDPGRCDRIYTGTGNDIVFGGVQADTIVANDGEVYVRSGSYDKTVRLWDAATGAHLATVKFPETGRIERVALSADGGRLEGRRVLSPATLEAATRIAGRA